MSEMAICLILQSVLLINTAHFWIFSDAAFSGFLLKMSSLAIKHLLLFLPQARKKYAQGQTLSRKPYPYFLEPRAAPIVSMTLSVNKL